MVAIKIKIIRIAFCAFDFKCCSLCRTYVNTELRHNSSASLSLWCTFINFFTLSLSIPDLKNPGPCNNNNYLSIFYQNVQGLIPFSQLNNPNPTLDQTKILEMHVCIYEQEPDIIILNDTWLKSTIDDNEIIPCNLYKIFRCDRSTTSHPIDPDNPKRYRRNGGGVLIAIKLSLLISSNIINIKYIAEFLAIELILEDKSKIIVATCYRVGTLGIENYRSISDIIRLLLRKKRVKKFFLIGDFNLNKANWLLNTSTNSVEQAFLDEFVQAGLVQLINEPTHIKGNILDILLTNSEHFMNDITVTNGNGLCKSDHYSIKFKVNLKVDRKKATKIKVFNFKRANWDLLNRDISHVDWNSILNNSNPDNVWTNFKSTLTHLMDLHIPKITIKSKFKPPWFDAECYEKCREKERLHTKFKRSKALNDEIKFATCRREFKSLMRKKIRDNLYCTDDNNIITKKFWAHVKNTSKSCRIPEIVRYQSEISSNTITKANMFNKFFYDQFSEPSTYDIDISIDTNEEYIDFSTERIKQLLNDINVNKACGPDNIPGIVLKHCLSSISAPLSQLFHSIYDTGIVPNEWKKANVVPIHKKGDKCDIKNCRPISLTCIVAKLMERIIQDELLIRTQEHLNDHQHGFLANKSCTTNLISLSDSINIALHNNVGSDIIYFDFQKAFDTVNHDLILMKLKNQFDINGYLLRFISSYLKDRTQRVILENSYSTFKPVNSGVPQGSILGPILFLLFVNDIADGINDETNISQYADDTKLWRAMYSERDCEILQSDIDKLNNWCHENNMKLHPDKCKVVSIKASSKNDGIFLYALPFANYSYTIGDTVIDYENSEKDLGVIVNNEVTWHEHQQLILTKASQMLGLTKRTCHFVTNANRKRTLYLTLVRSLFEHCVTVWRPVATTNIDKFERLQKNAVKWILNEEYTSYSTADTYYCKCKQLNILPMSMRFELSDLVLFHKIVHELIPMKLPEYILRYNGSSRLRNSNLDSMSFIFNNAYHTSNSRSKLYKSFYYRTIHIWNTLEFNTRNTADIVEFKRATKRHLWDRILDRI